MGKQMKKSRRGGRRGKRSSNAIAIARPLGGIDQTNFTFNDIVPIVINNPADSTVYTAIVNADVNGYTWQILNGNNTPVATGSNPYGSTTGQFGVQSMFYTEYYLKDVQMDITLSQGGGVYSMSPLVQFQNPNGVSPFVLGGGGFASLLSAPQNTQIHQPYSCHTQRVNYQKWLMAMTNRCWRKTLVQGTTQREFYPSDGPDVEDFVVPSVTSVFQVTIPAGRFAAGSGAFVLGAFKTRADYVFSQRRTDINDLLRTQGRLETPKLVNYQQYPNLPQGIVTTG